MKNIKFIIILIVSLGFLSSCTKEVALETKESNKRCVINELSVEQLTNLLYSKDLDSVQFIDIRNAHDYAIGHLPNAINMPSRIFFNKEQFKKINKDNFLIVYGYDSSSPRLISLLSSHYKKANLYVAKGGYEFIKTKIIDNFGIYSGIYDDEVPLCDFSKKMNEVASRAGAASDIKPKTKSAPSKPMIKRKKKAVSGGCG